MKKMYIALTILSIVVLTMGLLLTNVDANQGKGKGPDKEPTACYSATCDNGQTVLHCGSQEVFWKKVDAKCKIR